VQLPDGACGSETPTRAIDADIVVDQVALGACFGGKPTSSFHPIDSRQSHFPGLAPKHPLQISNLISVQFRRPSAARSLMQTPQTRLFESLHPVRHGSWSISEYIRHLAAVHVAVGFKYPKVGVDRLVVRSEVSRHRIPHGKVRPVEILRLENSAGVERRQRLVGGRRCGRNRRRLEPS
jgi:hypothetical protein